MHLEVLINIIIILVILASVLKRLKEVAKKSEELGAPPPVVPTANPELTGRTKEFPLEKRRMYGEPEEIEEQPSVFSEEFWEQQPEVPEPVVEEMVQQPVEEWQPVLYRETAVSKEEFKPRFQLGFGGSEVVKGIVMSEILGPPLSMREGNRF